MTLNGHFALNSVLRRYVWSSRAWLSKLGYSETCSECCRRTLNRKHCSTARFPCDSTAFLWPFQATRASCIETNISWRTPIVTVLCFRRLWPVVLKCTFSCRTWVPYKVGGCFVQRAFRMFHVRSKSDLVKCTLTNFASDKVITSAWWCRWRTMFAVKTVKDHKDRRLIVS